MRIGTDLESEKRSQNTRRKKHRPLLLPFQVDESCTSAHVAKRAQAPYRSWLPDRGVHSHRRRHRSHTRRTQPLGREVPKLVANGAEQIAAGTSTHDPQGISCKFELYLITFSLRVLTSSRSKTEPNSKPIWIIGGQIGHGDHLPRFLDLFVFCRTLFANDLKIVTRIKSLNYLTQK